MRTSAPLAVPVSGAGETPSKDFARGSELGARSAGQPGSLSCCYWLPSEAVHPPHSLAVQRPDPSGKRCPSPGQPGAFRPRAGLGFPGLMVKTTRSRVRSGGGAGVRR